MMSANMVAAPGAAPVATRRPAFAGLAAFWTAYRQRRAMRADLARLAATGDYLLRDIGLDPRWAEAEAEKPFWKP